MECLSKFSGSLKLTAEVLMATVQKQGTGKHPYQFLFVLLPLGLVF